jgi:hypothetical protein
MTEDDFLDVWAQARTFYTATAAAFADLAGKEMGRRFRAAAPVIAARNRGTGLPDQGQILAQEAVI